MFLWIFLNRQSGFFIDLFHANSLWNQVVQRRTHNFFRIFPLYILAEINWITMYNTIPREFFHPFQFQQTIILMYIWRLILYGILIKKKGEIPWQFENFLVIGPKCQSIVFEIYGNNQNEKTKIPEIPLDISIISMSFINF